jgi:phosphohistidine phosphatase
MELLLLRHAEAEPVGNASGGDDSERELTSGGRRDASAVGGALDRMDLAPARILTSPLRRARQTAQAVADAVGGTEISSVDDLSPGATPGRLMPILEGFRDRVLLVGHQPDLGRILSFLVSGGSMELDFQIRPATLAVVDVDAIPLRRAGRLLLFCGPALLRGISEGRKPS